MKWAKVVLITFGPQFDYLIYVHLNVQIQSLFYLATVCYWWFWMSFSGDKRVHVKSVYIVLFLISWLFLSQAYLNKSICFRIFFQIHITKGHFSQNSQKLYKPSTFHHNWLADNQVFRYFPLYLKMLYNFHENFFVFELFIHCSWWIPHFQRL